MGYPELDASVIDNWRVAVVYNAPREPVWSSEIRLMGFLTDADPNAQARFMRMPGDDLWIEFNRYEMTQRRAVFSGVETSQSALEKAGFASKKIVEMVLYKQTDIDLHRTLGQQLIAQDVTDIAQVVAEDIWQAQKICKRPISLDSF